MSQRPLMYVSQPYIGRHGTVSAHLYHWLGIMYYDHATRTASAIPRTEALEAFVLWCEGTIIFSQAENAYNYLRQYGYLERWTPCN